MAGSVWKRLRKLRKEHNFTQKDIGDFLGLSQSQLAKIESNERNIKLTKLLKLCDLYNVSEEYILYGEGGYDKNQIAFRKNNKSLNLKTIARMNRIMNNLKDIKELYMENFEDD